MDLVRDILDTQLVDRRGIRIGKVDGIALELRSGRAPRVAYVETGAVTLAARVHPRLGGWLAGLIRRYRLPLNAVQRIAWSQLSRARGNDLRVDGDAEAMEAFTAERWLRDRVIGRLPGAGR